MTNFSDKHVLLKSAINPKTGYGNDGISLARHLMELGADLHLDPQWVGIPLPANVAQLFMKERYEGMLDIIIDHMDPAQLMLPEGYVYHSKTRIAWTMWEFTAMSKTNDPWVRTLKQRLEKFNLVLAYDAISKMALEPFYDGEVHILQGGYESELWTPEKDQTREWDGTFRFAMAGALNRRKNPFTAVTAFDILKQRHGKDFDAELHLKTNMLGLHPAMEQRYEGLKIHLELWTHEQMKEFYAGINCLLAPSWGEGKNLPALEAQTMGVPVIVSAFGGHMQWADPEWSYLVGGKIEEHEDGMGSMRVDAEELSEIMWHVYTNRYEAKEKGYKASVMIPQQCDWSKVLERLAFKLTDLGLN